MDAIRISSRQICVSTPVCPCLATLLILSPDLAEDVCVYLSLYLTFLLTILQRILCFELVAKANSNWVLRYVNSAVGETDVPDALPEFISQRRRWLNGSFFAATYAIAHIPQMMASGHSLARKCWLLLQAFYNIINLIASWFAIVSSQHVFYPA